MIRDEVLTAEEVEGKSNTELLSKHILELQKDKGNLIDELTKKTDTNHQLVEQLAKLNERCSELEAENEQIKNSDTLCKLIGEQKIKIAELKKQLDLKEKALSKAKKETKRIADRVNKDKRRLIRRKTELEAQIEKMKCCYNCKHSRTEYEHCRTDKHEKWEIKENDKRRT